MSSLWMLLALSFAQPQLLLWLPLAPAVAVTTALVLHRRAKARAAWAQQPLADALAVGAPPPRPGTRWAVAVLSGVTVAALVIALAGPRTASSTSDPGGLGGEGDLPSVDVVFLLDSSRSMAAGDVSPSRLDVSRSWIDLLLRERPAGRSALIQVEADSVVLTPLTRDQQAVRLMLEGVAPGTLPRGGTDLGLALTAARRLLTEGESRRGAVVLLSDGEDHGTGLQGAAAALGDAGIAVLAVGIGTEEGAPVPLRRAFGGESSSGRAERGEWQRDARGEVVISRLGRDSLRSVAAASGGLYLESAGARIEGEPVLAALRSLAQRPSSRDASAPTSGEPAEASWGSPSAGSAEVFQWPLAFACGLLLWRLAAESGLFARWRRPTGHSPEPADPESSRQRKQRNDERNDERNGGRSVGGSDPPHGAQRPRGAPAALALLCFLTLAAPATDATPTAAPSASPPAAAPEIAPPSPPATRDDATRLFGALPPNPAALPSRSLFERLLSNPRQRTQQALERYDRGEYAQAAEAAQRAWLLDPENPELLYNLGTLRLAADDPQALQDLRLAVALADAQEGSSLALRQLLPDALYNLGNAMLREGDIAAAAEAYREALRRRPAHQEAKHNLEWALRQLSPPPPPPPSPPPPPPPPPSPSSGSGGGGGRTLDQAFGDSGAMPPQQSESLLRAVRTLELRERQEEAQRRQSEAPQEGKTW